MKYIELSGRILYALIFLSSALPHFSGEVIGFAASQGVPLASVLVPLSGIMAALGGLSIALGYKAKWGAWLLVAFLIPVTLMMHRFWTISDPMMARMDRVMFIKNLSMLGAALIIAWAGTGPLSLDRRIKRAELRAEGI